MGLILDRAAKATKDIATLEEQAEVLRVQRAADMLTITSGIADDESDRLSAGELGKVIGISRQNVVKAVQNLGPGTNRARAVARAQGKS